MTTTSDIESKLREIADWAGSRKCDTYHERLHAYEQAKQEAGRLCGWYGTNPDERVYNAIMKEIVEVLRI